ncbi:HNH endonuclease signature motif containing protein [Actinotalea sp. C106]|uniref:HNH endonuclease signature motif containing protein n=1 Tax=Actinotalea sp. C106 TaxID=2908644 RepID=UPI00202967A1|nr:HNH endonuclease signature motif containing protein [Actinotalea sp. C106]
MLPGPALAALLDQLGHLPVLGDRADVLASGHPDAPTADTEYDDAALVEEVAAWQRLVAWASAGAARAAARLADRPSMNPVWPDSAGTVSELNVAGEELAMRLGCSRLAARALVRDGRAFDGALAPAGAALECGEIDLARARVLVRALDEAPVPLALDVQDAVLPRARRRTCTQLGRDVERALISLDPEGAHRRHLAAARGRRLDRPRALPHGMASVTAVLPAQDAVRLDAGIDHLARSARAAGDPRTLDQLRADVLVDLTVGELSDEGGARDVAVAVAVAGDLRVKGRAAADVCSGAAAAGARSRRPSRPRAQIRVTIPFSSLLGTGGEPAELAGYGPITAEVAQALARGGTWRRIVTDPVTDAVLDVGRTRYRPPADLAEHVRARDGACVRPGCSTPADSCDLDHTVEFGRDGGTTSRDNLAPLCPRDHAIKTDGGFRLTQLAPGVFEWLTPAGLRYRVEPGREDAELAAALPPPPF